HKILALRKRIRAICGGTSASKTISILLWLIDYAQSTKGTLISVVSESFPHLQRGAMRDFLTIMKEHGYFQDARWNQTNHIYEFETGSKIEFFSADQSDKLRGARRDILFINEANNIPFNAYNELEVRTKDVIWLDWNPTNEFWFYTELKNNPNIDLDFITLTYKDNEALDEQIIQSIESRRDNKNWYLVYGLGQLGVAEGRIYQDWQIVDEIPHEARLERRGLDFGYSNDPAAIVDVYYYNGGYILHEQLYQRGMFNKQLADFISNLPMPQALVKADSAEPKSIDEIKSYGINMVAVTKGADSVRQGINYLQGQRISMTKTSLNLIKEYRNYMWKTDINGKSLLVPDETDDHLLDASRYALEGLGDRYSILTKHKYVNVGGDPVTGFGRRRVRRGKSIEDEMNALIM